MLICIGVVMVYSTSSAAALLSDESPQGLLVRQGIYAVIGLIVFAACARLSPSRLVAIGKPAMIVSIVAVSGSRRSVTGIENARASVPPAVGPPITVPGIAAGLPAAGV